jgi:hypothetical protein
MNVQIQLTRTRDALPLTRDYIGDIEKTFVQTPYQQGTRRLA